MTKPKLCDECSLRTDGWVLVKEKDLLTRAELKDIKDFYGPDLNGGNDEVSFRELIRKLKSLTKEVKA